MKILNESEISKTLQTLTSPHRSYFAATLSQRFDSHMVDKNPIKKKKLRSPPTQVNLQQKTSRNFFRASSIGAMYHEPFKAVIESNESGAHLP